MAGIQYPALVNGVAYDWSNIICSILGRPVIGITNITYASTQDMENNYGAGCFPITRGYGNVVATASITLTIEEVENLQTIAPDGMLQNIPEFDIIVMYMSNLTNPKTHIIKNCRFTTNQRTMNQNDMNSVVEITLLPTHIVFNG